MKHMYQNLTLNHINYEMCKLVLVIITIGATICLQYYLCVNLLLHIIVATFLKSDLI